MPYHIVQFIFFLSLIQRQFVGVIAMLKIPQGINGIMQSAAWPTNAEYFKAARTFDWIFFVLVAGVPLFKSLLFLTYYKADLHVLVITLRVRHGGSLRGRSVGRPADVENKMTRDEARLGRRAETKEAEMDVITKGSSATPRASNPRASEKNVGEREALGKLARAVSDPLHTPSHLLEGRSRGATFSTADADLFSRSEGARSRGAKFTDFSDGAKDTKDAKEEENI